MLKRNIIFIAGVHGVGKGYCCKKLAPIIDGQHISASGLIRNRKSLGAAKTVEGIDVNQSILIEELENYKSDKPYILLDGHFCLFNTKLEIQFLPLVLFSELKIDSILLLTCAPKIIMERLNDRDQGSPNLTRANIEKLQDAEITHANEISLTLRIPLKELDTSTNITSEDIDVLYENIKGN